MSTQEELRQEHERLFEAGDFEAANNVLDKIEPLSDEEWLRQLRDAPADDEPLTAIEAQRITEFEAFLSEQVRRQAG